MAHQHLRALDSSKAFDKVNHFGLYSKLMNRSVPIMVLYFHSFVYCRQQGPYKDMTQGNMKRKHEHKA